MKYKIKLNDAPDKYGLPTDEELEAELNAKKESIRKQREQAVAKEQKEIKERQERESKYAKDLNIIRNAKNIEDMQEIYPDQGKADTIAGELVRAYARLRYRWYNDGDTFFTGYGYTDTCSSPAAFICEHTDLYQDFFDFADPYNLEYGKDPYGRGCYGEFVDPEKMGYSQFIEDLGKNLFNYIKTNKEDLIKPTTDMFDEDGERYFEEYYPRYSWVVEIPYDVREKASTRDIYDYFENLYYGNSYSDIEVTVGYNIQDVQVDNLTEDEYAEALNWNTDQLWDDFRTEYGITEEDEEEDVDLDDCEFKDSDYLESLFKEVYSGADQLSNAYTNSQEKSREEYLRTSIQRLCTISEEEVKNSLKTTQGLYTKKSVSKKLSELSENLKYLSRVARNISSRVKLEVLSEAVSDCSKEISKLK